MRRVKCVVSAAGAGATQRGENSMHSGGAGSAEGTTGFGAGTGGR